MNRAWIRAQDRRRGLIATASTVCLYALAFSGAYLVGILAPATLASVPGTVIVDLGGTVGPPGEIPQGLETAPDRPPDAPPGAAPLPAAASAAPAAPEAPNALPSNVAAIPEPVPAEKAQAKAPAKAVLKPTPKAPPKAAAKSATPPAKTIPVKDAAAVAAEAAAAKVAAEKLAAQTAKEEEALRAAAATARASAGPPKTRTFGSGAASGSAPVSGTGAGTGSVPGVAGGTGSVTFRGGEKGSALTTTFGASSGQVGRTLYEPIWMFMPLPKTVSDSVYQIIQTKATFRTIYQQSGSDWKLISQLPVAQRSDVWNMLDSANYDASTADFRTERKLSPVVLEFAVGPLTKKGKAEIVELVEVRLVSSSGSSEVDEAVIYGFKRGAYFNKTGNAVSGKFVYGF